MTRFQNSIIFRGKCVAQFAYVTQLHNGNFIKWGKNDSFEYVILDTKDYNTPLQRLNTHRILIDGYWLPMFQSGFDMHFYDLSKWREIQIDSILED